MATKKPDPLLAYIRVQKDLDRRMYSLLNQAASDIDRQIKNLLGDGVGAQVRRDQLLYTKKIILVELSQMMTKAGYSIQALKYEAAAAAVKTNLAYEKVLFQALPEAERGVFEIYSQSALRQARNGVDAAEQRLLGASYRPLAESVYNTAQLQAGQVDRLINSALARGLSARELAGEVRQFIKPTAPGGASYSAMRLARTELNNAFHAKAAQQIRDSDFSDGAVWHLSGSHGRPDECNEYAQNDEGAGYPQGFFFADDIPSKPHPNCLCFITPEIVNQDDFLDNFFSGKYDRLLDRVMTAA